jgi:hypothetical protein
MTRPTTNPTDSFKPFTVRGRVEMAAREGCVELASDRGRYVLLGEAVAGLAAGDEVIVQGIAAPQLHTLCEGSPLRVTEVRRP